MPKYNLNFCRYKLILVTIIAFSTLNKVNTLHKISPKDFSSVNVNRSKRNWLGLIVNSWLRIVCKKTHLQWVPKVFIEHLQWVLPKKRIALWIPRAAKHWEKCPYSEFFWSVFSRIWTEYGEMLAVSLLTQSECGKIWARKIPNTDTFHALKNSSEIGFGLRISRAASWDSLEGLNGK